MKNVYIIKDPKHHGKDAFSIFEASGEVYSQHHSESTHWWDNIEQMTDKCIVVFAYINAEFYNEHAMELVMEIQEKGKEYLQKILKQVVGEVEEFKN